MSTPYAEYVTGKDVLEVLRETHAQYSAVFAKATPGFWAAEWQPGKWTRHRILVHVAQWELLFSARVRMALAIPDYIVQPMEQDPLLEYEAPWVDAPTAAAAFDAMRAMNIGLVAGLAPAVRARAITHPERGRIDINDLIVSLAGHAEHHLRQIDH